jgi:hypothetical protein
VWRLLCAASLLVYLVAAISAKLNKSDDLATCIGAAEACNAALEGLRADVEFSKLPVKVAVGEYGQIVARILFVPENFADDTDSSDRGRLEVVIPGMAIMLAGVILVTTVIGFVLGLGRGVAAAAPQVSLVLSHSQVRIGDTYSATASGFSPGEVVQFSWAGPTHGTMDALPADSGGGTARGIVEKDPPGNYTIVVMGLTSGRTASAGLQVVQPGN